MQLLQMAKKTCEGVILDAALSLVHSRLLTCTAGVVDTPVLAANLHCWLSESCLGRFSLSCTVSAATCVTCTAGVVDTPASLVSSQAVVEYRGMEWGLCNFYGIFTS